MEVTAHYLQDLASQGVDVLEFSLDWLPEQPPNFIKRKKEPSEKSKKSKTLKLGEPSAARSPAPLDSSIPSKSLPFETPSHSNLKQLSSSLPQTSSTFTPYEPTISYPHTSEHHNSDPSLFPPRQINLTTTTLPASDFSPLSESLSSLSSTPSSPPYYDISFDSEQPANPDPSSPTLAQLQAIALSNQPPPIPNTSIPSTFEPQIEPLSEPHREPPSEQPSEQPSEPPTRQPSEPPTKTTHTSTEPINPSSKPEPTFPTLKDTIALFSESSVVKLRSLSEQSNLSDNPSEVRNH
ncbi:extensin-like [Lathyrus oleraceus]|uniref:extensin-like n=1 Tax=Pisum sativum TaxID=3888 RepID=UPI0021D1FCDB|nr:extensin-like [Pisum sativum]